MSASYSMESKPCAARSPMLSVTALARLESVQRLLTATLEERTSPRAPGRLRKIAVPMRKFVAFIGLLGVIYALAVQHGAFDHAVAPTQSAAAASRELPGSCDENLLAAAL